MDQGLEQLARGDKHYTNGVKAKKKEEGTGSREGSHSGAKGCARPKTCVHGQVRRPGVVLREKPHLPQCFRGAKSPLVQGHSLGYLGFGKGRFLCAGSGGFMYLQLSAYPDSICSW